MPDFDAVIEVNSVTYLVEHKVGHITNLDLRKQKLVYELMLDRIGLWLDRKWEDNLHWE